MRLTALILLAVAAALAAPAAAQTTQVTAGTLQFYVCDNVTFKKRQDGMNDKVDIYCPPQVEPRLSVVGCVNPKVTRVGKQYSIKCESWVKYDYVQPK